MAPYFHLAVGATLFEHLFQAYLDIRQRGVVATMPVPTEKERAVEIIQAKARSKIQKGLSLLRGAVALMETMFVLYASAIASMWCWSKTVVAAGGFQVNEYSVTVVFASSALVYENIKGILWSLWEAYTMNAHAPGSKQTIRVGPVLRDALLSTGVTLVLMQPILYSIVYIVHTTGDYMPLYLWAFICLLQLSLMSIYPTLIAPLFERYIAFPDCDLRKRIDAMATSLGLHAQDIYIMDASKRNGHANAHVYGIRKRKRIIIYSTLLQQCSEEQVLAILAHEFGHWKHGHVLKLFTLQQVIMLVQFIVFTCVYKNRRFTTDFGFDQPMPSIVSITLFLTIMSPFDKLVGWAFNTLSRRFENEADATAVLLGYAMHLRDAIKQLDKDSQEDPVVDHIYSQYHHSHPLVSERLRALSMNATYDLHHLKNKIKE